MLGFVFLCITFSIFPADLQQSSCIPHGERDGVLWLKGMGWMGELMAYLLLRYLWVDLVLFAVLL